MKKYLGIIALLIGISFAACAHSKKTPRKSRQVKGQTITTIQMSRGACFGRCPVYTITVHRNGLVRYEGKQSTEFTGTYEKEIGAAAVANLFDQATAYRVDTLQGGYEVRIADLPGLDLTFVYGSKEQHVNNANFGPRFLGVYAKEIDEVIKVDKTWKRLADEKVRD